MSLANALVVVVLVIFFMCLSDGVTSAVTGPCSPRTLDDLPVLPRAVSVHQFSSHNRQGLNGDCDWGLYQDENKEFVIFDAVGPGCLRSFWQTIITNDRTLRFYFDGEKEPRYTVKNEDLYEGKCEAFKEPLCAMIVAGHWEGDKKAGNCFTPIPFAKSLKITTTVSPSIYHFIYERYPGGTPVTTFTGKEDQSYLLKTFEKQGEELQPHLDAEMVKTAIDTIQPGGSPAILSVEKPGTVTRIVIEASGSDDLLHSVDIQAKWDESLRPDVLAPIGMFFGSGVRAENVRSLPTKVEKLDNGRIRMTCYFRMPFWRKANILLVNRMSQPTGSITAEVHVAPNRYEEDRSGYFCALYRDGRTEMGRDWLFCDVTGTGWFVGAVQTMFGGHYCEGDEHITVDGSRTPQLQGTGSEDYYLGCFWPNYDFNLPFAGCVGDITVTPGPGCYYRFHVDAPIPFYKSLNASIQHGGNSDIVSHYQSVGFYYVRHRPAMRLTDFIDVGNEVSEKAHGYHATKSKLTGTLDATYEGNEAWIVIRDEGRTHEGGDISFNVAVSPENAGVRLRRRLDQNGPRQSAEVYVNGKYAGTWYHPCQNPYLRWYDSEFDVPAALTEGKKSLSILLKVKHGPYTDFNYEVLTTEDSRRDCVRNDDLMGGEPLCALSLPTG